MAALEPFRFEDWWGPSGIEPGVIADRLPTIEAAGRDDVQVGVPAPAEEGYDLRRNPPPPSSLDELADKPWVTSVVAASRVEASVALPQIRSLFVVDWWGDEPDDATIASLPNLEQAVLPEALPEQLLRLSSLQDLVLGGWRTYDLTDEQRRELTRDPSGLEALPRLTAGPGVLGQLPALQRLRIPREVFDEPVDPIADLPALRWLDVYGWRNHRALGRATGLERLSLRGASMSNLKSWRRLTGLRELVLDGNVRSLEGVEALTALERLDLGLSRDRDVSPVGALQNLRELSIGADDAPTGLEAVGRLGGLRRFSLLLGDINRHGRLPSIGFLAGLAELEEVVLRVVELVDGRLDPLFDLPRLRRVVLTGATGPNVAELGRGRPDVEVETHLAGEPAGRVHVGPAWYDPPRPGSDRWSILQDLHALLGTEVNDDAERRLRSELRRRDRDLLARLEFDSESGAVGVYAGSEEDIRSVAEAIRDLAATRSGGG